MNKDVAWCSMFNNKGEEAERNQAGQMLAASFLYTPQSVMVGKIIRQAIRRRRYLSTLHVLY